jgi:hypothetical protein
MVVWAIAVEHMTKANKKEAKLKEKIFIIFGLGFR